MIIEMFIHDDDDDDDDDDAAICSYATGGLSASVVPCCIAPWAPSWFHHQGRRNELRVPVETNSLTW